MHVDVNVNLQNDNFIMIQEFLSGNWIIETIWRSSPSELNNKYKKIEIDFNDGDIIKTYFRKMGLKGRMK